MLVHTLRRARNDTEITGPAPSVRLRSLACPLAGRRSIYERGRMGIGWGHKESGYGLGGRGSGLGGTQPCGPLGSRPARIRRIGLGWQVAGASPYRRPLIAGGLLIRLAVPAPAFGRMVFVVVLSVLGVQGFGGGRYPSDRLNRLRRGCALLVCQRRHKVQQAERDQPAHERSHERDLLTDPRKVTRYPYTVHVHCPTIFDGQILLARQRVGARERSTLQVPGAFANRPGASVCDAKCRITAQHPTIWHL